MLGPSIAGGGQDDVTKGALGVRPKVGQLPWGPMFFSVDAGMYSGCP